MTCFNSVLSYVRERRVGQNMASALEKLSQIKNYYNEAGRPRFVQIRLFLPINLLTSFSLVPKFFSQSGLQKTTFKELIHYSTFTINPFS